MSAAAAAFFLFDSEDALGGIDWVAGFSSTRDDGDFPLLLEVVLVLFFVDGACFFGGEDFSGRTLGVTFVVGFCADVALDVSFFAVCFDLVVSTRCFLLGRGSSCDWREYLGI